MFNQGIIEFWPADLLTQVFQSDIHTFEQVAEGGREGKREEGEGERTQKQSGVCATRLSDQHFANRVCEKMK